MRLHSLEVKNFRSVRDSGVIRLRPVFAFVGENNTGKSNLLRAIEVLMSAGTGRLSQSDFNDPAQPIVITAVFGDLTAQDKRRWKPYLVDGSLKLEKRLSLARDDRTNKEKIEAEFHGYHAEPTEWHLSIEKIMQRTEGKPKWAEIAAAAGLPEYFFSEDGKSNKNIFAKALGRYLDERDVAYDAPDISQTHALGFQSNAVAALPKVYLLPAITDYSDEIDRRSSSSTFRRLMAALSERILEQDPRYAELQTALDTIRRLLNPATEQAQPARIGALGVVEAKLRELLQRTMPSVTGVSLFIEVDEVQSLISSGVGLKVNDGVETDVLSKGHGLQRCIVFALLQALILYDRDELVGRVPAQPIAQQTIEPIILLVEEPELYLHPQLAKLFFDVMTAFGATDQVIYTTHSPLFVDAYEAESVGIVSKTDVANGSKVRCYDARAFEGLGDKKMFQGFTKLNPEMNELFFAKRVLLVEGPEDVIAITAALKKLEMIRTRIEELAVSVVPCAGKQAMPFFQRVLNAFAIPYAVLHDVDIEEGMGADKKAMHERDNAAIQALANGAQIYTFPFRLEATVGLPEHFKDQYTAYQFFSDTSKVTPELEEIVLGIFL